MTTIKDQVEELKTDNSISQNLFQDWYYIPNAPFIYFERHISMLFGSCNIMFYSFLLVVTQSVLTITKAWSGCQQEALDATHQILLN